MTPFDRSQSLPMSSQDGDRVRGRRERLKMDKLPLAEAAGVSRDTLASVEEGKGFRSSTLRKIEDALDELEDAAGLPPWVDPQPVVGGLGAGVMEFEVSGDFGVHVIVRGPVANADILERQVENILRDIRRGSKNGDSNGGVEDES